MAATIEYFTGKFIQVDSEQIPIDAATAKKIYRYPAVNEYIDYDDKITDRYRNDLAAGTLAPLPFDIAHMGEGIHKLVHPRWQLLPLLGHCLP